MAIKPIYPVVERANKHEWIVSGFGQGYFWLGEQYLAGWRKWSEEDRFWPFVLEAIEYDPDTQMFLIASTQRNHLPI